jgi:uncharacterized lipoprotein
VDSSKYNSRVQQNNPSKKAAPAKGTAAGKKDFKAPGKFKKSEEPKAFGGYKAPAKAAGKTSEKSFAKRSFGKFADKSSKRPTRRP